MRINEIIKERRLAKGFTQEQIANYLGVTAPAVNKWEKGTSCPDIVLLPALARLLDTDLNTLLSFQDDLSEKEVALFLNEVSEAAKKDGFEAGYSLAIGKIKEYPTCDLLLGNVAMLLNGLLLFQGNRIDSYEKYEEEIEALFQRVMQSDRIDIREQAQAYLISKLMEKQDYEIYLATLRERNRIAREIHDNVGHMLSRSILQMGALITIHKEEPLHGQLAGVGETLNQAMNSIRESVHDLHDESIDLRQSIAEATREMKEHYQLTVDYDMSPEIPRNVKYCFITAVKEAMSNIAKHSDADKISVILREHPAFYQLTVEDNGTVGRKGQSGPLWEEEVVRMDGKEGIGLSNMKERVQALGGTFRIHTEKGFVIFISIPKRDKM